MTDDRGAGRTSQRARLGRNSRNYMAGRDLIIQSLKITPKRVVLAILTALVFIAAYVVGHHYYNDWTAADSTEAQRKAAKTVDSESTPFTAQYLFDTKVPENWSIVLDRKLTSDEIAGLKKLDGADGQAVWGYLRPLGGRLLPGGDQPALAYGGPMRTTETFRMSLLSDRSSTLTIENISVSNVKCIPSSAVTLIDLPPQGGGAVDQVAFDLQTPEKPIAETDDNGIIDHDYFAKHKIDLGAGATPGTLRVTAVGVLGKSCSWEFRADYATVDDQSSITLDNNGKPFTLESRPDRPLQHIQYGFGPGPDGSPWVDCAAPGIQCGP
ncbi:hypothetical protein [Nocardia vaccinii]|uniref:hypothetical protein n=1 Tax=Nocardia vaccinii TaxID=1822 RepID=UPI00082DC4FE|nr:hypothetical protein [Nocardia vaccinii]